MRALEYLVDGGVPRPSSDAGRWGWAMDYAGRRLKFRTVVIPALTDVEELLGR